MFVCSQLLLDDANPRGSSLLLLFTNILSLRLQRMLLIITNPYTKLHYQLVLVSLRMSFVEHLPRKIIIIVVPESSPFLLNSIRYDAWNLPVLELLGINISGVLSIGQMNATFCWEKPGEFFILLVLKRRNFMMIVFVLAFPRRTPS